MSEAKNDSGKLPLPAPLAWVGGRVFTKGAMATLVLLALGGLGTSAAQAWATDRLEHAIDEKVDAGLADASKRVTTLERKVDELARVQSSEADRNARRFEVLYNVVLTRQAQPGAAELARPPDGGQ